jgi:hypothetical protein
MAKKRFESKQKKRQYWIQEIKESQNEIDEFQNFEGLIENATIDVLENKFFQKPLFAYYPNQLFTIIEVIIDECIRSFLPKIELLNSIEENHYIKSKQYSIHDKIFYRESIHAKISKQNLLPERFCKFLTNAKQIKNVEKESQFFITIMNKNSTFHFPRDYVKVSECLNDLTHLEEISICIWINKNLVYFMQRWAFGRVSCLCCWWRDAPVNEELIWSMHVDEFIKFFPNLQTLSTCNFEILQNFSKTLTCNHSVDSFYTGKGHLAQTREFIDDFNDFHKELKDSEESFEYFSGDEEISEINFSPDFDFAPDFEFESFDFEFESFDFKSWSEAE